ncbi:basic proline-rich protein-like [Hippopotamus amphibius kiboko]|uniref:basic proline-rich protein-like n=1 Tax=Hippopotamus amphibius kiboko TaxID=575201 RepID=UPI0025913D30|nr:basic proline-rich protein-like [Hippopotamus amphibius kiboko]
MGLICLWDVSVSYRRGSCVLLEPGRGSVGIGKAQRCQPIWVRVREHPTEECVQCPHPQPLSEARTAPAKPDLSLPSPPGSPLLPQRGGPGRAQEETGTRPLGLGVWGGLLERSVELLGRKVGRAGMRGLWRGPGDLGFSSRGSAREPGVGGPPPSAVTSRSRPPPRGGGAFPLCGPGAPGPAPGPLPPGRSLPSGGGGGGVRDAGLRAPPGRCPFPRVNSLLCPPAGRRGRAAAASAPRPVTDFRARSGWAAPAPRTNHSQATAGRPGGLAAAARPLPAAGSPAAGSMVGSGPRGAQLGSRDSRGPARTSQARLCPPPSSLLSPALLPALPSRRAGEGKRRGPRCRPPLASRRPGLGLPRASLPPSLFLSRSPPPRAPRLPPAAPLRLGLALPDFCAGLCPPGSRDPALPGSRWPPPGSAGRPGFPPRSRPRRADSRNAASPPGPSRGRPAVPPPARTPLAGAAPGSPARPRLGTPRGKDGNRISRLPGGGGCRGLGRLAPTCSEWEGEPRLRRSFNNPIRQAHSQVFFARFRIFFFFFFSVWDILQTFFF